MHILLSFFKICANQLHINIIKVKMADFSNHFDLQDIAY